MSDRRVVHEHPQKVRVADVEPDESLDAGQGWMNMSVQWVITRSTAGSERTVFGITTMPPGARHDIHRHPNAEEVVYLVEGTGLARVGEVDVRMGAGDVVVARPDEPHGFYNDHPTDNAVLVWCYSGAASLDEAGYVYEPDARPHGELRT